jgi:hypothetical protein
MKRASSVVALRAREARLKQKVRAHLRKLGLAKQADGLLGPSDLSKDAYRTVHAHQRSQKLENNRKWLTANASRLLPNFASGTEVRVDAVRPRLEIADGSSLQGDIFRFATLYWRVPTSEGYGRRLRFLVWDDNTGKLIGLFALGDAVFNLRARDELIGWDHKRRAEGLVNLMDAYVLGAVPPYNMLLGGKLVASLVRSLDVVTAFKKRYADSVGVISKKKKGARLAAVTTASALGRSSIYNRLKLGDREIFRPIGYTSGWGHFHISDELFDELRRYLKDSGDEYANGFKFGSGPNWRLRVIKRGLRHLGLDPNLIRHGFPRELFLCPIADNAVEFLSGRHKRIRYGTLPSALEVGAMARDRWMVPRSERYSEYRNWRREQFLEQVLGEHNFSVDTECIGRKTG